MKEKNVAGILALFLGGFGVHRFYLGQTGLGVFYLIFCWFPIMWVVGLIDAIAFFSMDQDKFDKKYNEAIELGRYRRDTDFDRRDYRRRERYERAEERRENRNYESRQRYERPKPRPRPQAKSAKRQEHIRKVNAFKLSGIKKYKDFDYDAAIEDFLEVVKLAPKDIATHFNLACAYSLNEETEQSFYHLDQAVANGFNDFKRIKEHDALAYVRIQEQFDEFEQNGFRLVAANKIADKANEIPLSTTVPSVESEDIEDLLSQEPNLLEQLKQLGELRDKGLLTEAEFASQKRKLLE